MTARFEVLKSAPPSFKGLHKLHEFPTLRRRAALEPVVKSHLADSHHPAGGLVREALPNAADDPGLEIGRQPCLASHRSARPPFEPVKPVVHRPAVRHCERPVRRPAPLPGTALRAPVHGQALCRGLFLRFRAIPPPVFRPCRPLPDRPRGRTHARPSPSAAPCHDACRGPWGPGG